MDVVLGWMLVVAILGGVALLVCVNEPARRRRRTLLELEALGVRIVPAATHTFTGLGVTSNVSEAANWSDNTRPVAGDALVFDGTSNKLATYDAAAPAGIGSILIQGAAAGQIQIATNLTVMTSIVNTAAAGQISVGAGVQVSTPTLTLRGGTMNSAGQVLAGILTVSSSATISSTQVTANSFEINGSVTLDQGAAVVNTTHGDWNSGQINVLNGSKIVNAGEFDVFCDQTLRAVGGGVFNNAGLFKKLNTTGTTFLTIAFNNQPVPGYPVNSQVEVDSGTLEFDRNGSQAGMFAANGPGVLDFSTGTQTLGGGTMFGGSGTFRLHNAGIVSAAAGVSITISTMNFDLGASGKLSGSGSYTVNSQFKWDGGDMKDASVTANGALHITGATLMTMTNAHLAIIGTTTWDSTADIEMTGSSINNSGAFTATSANKITNVAVNGQPSSSFTNLDDGQGHRGSFTKTASPAVTTIDVDFHNSADLYFNGSPIAFTQTFDQSGSNSTTHLDGGTMTVASTFDLAAGTLFGAGTIQGSIKVEGTIDLGSSVGVLTVNGDYNQTATGTLKVKIGGANAGQYDVVNVQGQATLLGQLQVLLINGYITKAADRFKVLTAGVGVAGNFSSVTPGWNATANANDLTLTHP